MHSAMSLFYLFALTAVAAANLHAPILFGFAFTSTIAPVDEAFGGKPLDSQPDSWLVDAAALAATLTITADLGELDVPKSFRQAMRSPQRDYWREAMVPVACVRPQQCARLGHLRRLELGDSLLCEWLPDLLSRVPRFHWFSKMQKSVSLSSAEAEYFGAMMAA